MKINGKRFAVIVLAAFVATAAFAKASSEVDIVFTESEKVGVGDLTYKANDEIEIVEGSVSDFVTALHMPNGNDAFYFVIPKISESDFPNEKTVVYISNCYKEMKISEKINGHTVVGMSLDGIKYKNGVLNIPEGVVFLGDSPDSSIKTINFPNHKILFAKPRASDIRNGETDDWFEYCNNLDEKSKSELRRVGYTGKIGQN